MNLAASGQLVCQADISTGYWLKTDTHASKHALCLIKGSHVSMSHVPLVPLAVKHYLIPS